jgi:hypothetical protein
MPFMQRITWSGVALHEGVLPGHPASHGCIRTSHDFAQKLWPITKLGVRFVVSRHEIVPVDFDHPKLFAPLQKPPEAGIVMNGPGDGVGGERIKLAQVSDDREAAQASDAVPAAAPNPSGTEDLAKPPPVTDPSKPFAPRSKSAEQPVKRVGQVAVFVSRKEKKVFVRQGMVPMFDAPVTIDEPDQPLGLHVFTALGPTEEGGGMRWNLMTIPTDGSIRVEYRRMSHRRGREPAPPPVIPTKPPSTAGEALDRVHMPQEAVNRISELLIPGSSLVIADEGLGRETGRGTEFIVLTH